MLESVAWACLAIRITSFEIEGNLVVERGHNALDMVLVLLVQYIQLRFLSVVTEKVCVYLLCGHYKRHH